MVRDLFDIIVGCHKAIGKGHPQSMGRVEDWPDGFERIVVAQVFTYLDSKVITKGIIGGLL